MRIDVIGGGAIGLLFGSRLAKAGADVHIWTRTRRQAAELAEEGIELRPLDGSAARTVRVKSGWIGDADHWPGDANRDDRAGRFLLLTVKQTDVNEQLLEQLAVLACQVNGHRPTIVCLQNGVGHLERIKSRTGEATVLAAVTTEGAKRLNARSVQHTGSGDTWIGPWPGNGNKLDHKLENQQKMLISMLQTAGFASSLSNEMENLILRKLMINAVINPLTALYDVTNGELPQHPARKRLMKALLTETETVLRAAGMNIREDGWRLIEEVCDRTGGNVSSMLSDVRAGRKTEIDSINGQIVKMAENLLLAAPLNQAIVELVHALD